MSKDAPKKNKYRSAKRLKAIKILSADVGMPVSEAMRQAGYSESSARQSQRITKSETFKDVLNRIGFTDERLAKGYEELAGACVLKEQAFPSKKISELVDIDEEDEGYDPELKDKKQFKEDYHWEHVSDKAIKAAIARMPGCELISIRDDYNQRVALYTAPEHAPRAKALELASKAKGSFSPEQVNVTIEEEVLTAEEQKALDNIRKGNA